MVSYLIFTASIFQFQAYLCKHLLTPSLSEEHLRQRNTERTYKSLKYGIEKAKLLVPAVQMGNPRVVEFKELAQNQKMEV